MAWIKGSTSKEQEYFDFFERLRQSGITNMWGGAAYLLKVYTRMKRERAVDLLSKWMKAHEDSDLAYVHPNKRGKTKGGG